MSERIHVKRQSTQTPGNRTKDTNQRNNSPETQEAWHMAHVTRHRTHDTGHRTQDHKNLILAKETLSSKRIDLVLKD